MALSNVQLTIANTSRIFVQGIEIDEYIISCHALTVSKRDMGKCKFLSLFILGISRVAWQTMVFIHLFYTALIALFSIFFKIFKKFYHIDIRLQV